MTDNPHEELVFRAFKQRVAPAALALGIVALVAVMYGTRQLHPLIGSVPSRFLGLLLVLGLVDYLSGFGSGWLSRRLAAKLRRADERFSTAGGRLVGLALASRTVALSRLVETDDDVGFLFADADGLRFRGDRTRFDLPWSRVTGTGLAPNWWLLGLASRVRVTHTADEPESTIFLDIRDRPLRTLCEADNRRLARRLVALRLESRRLAHGGFALD